MNSRSHPGRRRDDIQLGALIRLSFEPIVRCIRCALLQARMRSLQGLVDYFEWQATNAREGLADTHKRIALTRSDLNSLR